MTAADQNTATIEGAHSKSTANKERFDVIGEGISGSIYLPKGASKAKITIKWE